MFYEHKFNLGTIHLRHRQIFMIFDPYPPPVSKFDQLATPSPIENADVLNGWSLMLKIGLENHAKVQ